MKKRLIIFIFVLITVFATVALLSACDDLSGLLGGGDVDGNNEVCKHTNIRHKKPPWWSGPPAGSPA